MPRNTPPEITLTISSGNNRTYHSIMLRKFFAMVFIDPSGKKLNFFIATVFGGIADKPTDENAFPVTSYDSSVKCFLDFSFQSKLISEGECSIKDLTQEFWGQKEQIEAVWCNGSDKSGIIEYDQKTAADRLGEMYPELYPKGTIANIVLDPASPKICEIKKETKKEAKKETHQCMVTRGEFNRSPDDSPKYSITMPRPVNGLEAMNWIETDLVLTESILNKRVRFTIKLGSESGKSDTVFYTPDFTWYFAPPPGSVVNENTAELFLGDDPDQRLKNNIQNVRDDTTVLFYEWKELGINNRKKARIQLKQWEHWDYPFTSLSEAGTVTAYFETSRPQVEAYRQFILGLVVAFILSFCSDKTRINDFYDCLHRLCTCLSEEQIEQGMECVCRSMCNGISFFAPIFVLISYYVYAYDPKKCLPPTWKKEHKKASWRALNSLRWINLGLFVILVVYIFGAWPILTQYMGSLINCEANRNFIYIASGICSVSDIVFILIMKYGLHAFPKAWAP